MKIFFSGIAGSGVSAIAGFMADRGHSITGSDRVFDANPLHPMKKVLEAKGIEIVPQDGSGIDKTFDCAVFSTAVEEDNSELLKAQSSGIPISTRPEYLAWIASSFKTIAVAGTSGKSTTSGMLAYLMKRLGLSPNFIGGGRVKQFRSPLSTGNCLTGDSEYLVIEACESDGTIIYYRPNYSIVLNLDLDHHPVDETAEMFRTLARNTLHGVIINADDNHLKQVFLSPLPAAEGIYVSPDTVGASGSVTQGKGLDNVITFSIYNPSLYRAEDIVYKQFSTGFLLRGTRFVLSLPGEYNLYNALACIAFLSEIGVKIQDVAAVLPEFQGIDRRFDVHLNDGERLVIDDYAHNPHKILSLMKTMQKLAGRICYIFQPHGFGPTRMMKKEYTDVFVNNLRDTDLLVLFPIYYQGGTAVRDISSRDLEEGVKKGGKLAITVELRDDVMKCINDYDAFVVFGARDETLSEFAVRIAERIAGESRDYS
jgi:UDP-N-acetylmuramate--alanine ligase